MKIIKVQSQLRKTNKRVAAYCRVSTSLDTQEVSFESQVEYYTNYINGVKDWDYVEVYADQGFSGLSSDRPEFQRMIQDCLDGKIDIVLTKSISRFGRNAAEVQKYVHLLKEHMVEVRFEKEGISSMDPTAELVFNFMTAIAQEESRSISENVRWGNDRRAQKGVYHLGNNSVVGYDEINGKLTPNKDSWVIKYMFEEYANGKSCTAIARELAEKGFTGLRKKDDRPIGGTTIKRDLRNPIFMGDRYIFKNPPTNYLTKKPDLTVDYTTYYLPDDHEPIVSKELWNKVQERLDWEESLVKKGLMKTNTSTHLYGLLFCGECGQPMIRKTLHYKGELQKVYMCRGRMRKTNDCTIRPVSVVEMHQALCMRLNIKWKGEEAITDKTFSKIEEVRFYDDRHVEVDLKEKKKSS